MTVQIVTAADANYLPYLAALLASLEKFPAEITVIHRGISRQIQNRFHSHIRWFEPTPGRLSQIGAPHDFATCTPHYYRLLIPYLIPAQRALYLDADTLVLRDLSPLWNLQFAHPIAAVRDYLPTISQAVSNWQELSLDPNAPYFNSGVMLLNLDFWRREDCARRILDLCRKNEKYLSAQNKWPQYDQYGLNVHFHHNWKELSDTWNYGTDRLPADAHIIHFIGNGKIERPTCRPYFRKIFLGFNPVLHLESRVLKNGGPYDKHGHQRTSRH